MANKEISIDLRQVANEITVSVQLRNGRLVRLGLFFMRIGCWIGGFTLVDEFPMSLLNEKGEAIGKKLTK